MPKRDEHAIKNWREKWVIYFSFRAIFVWFAYFKLFVRVFRCPLIK